MEVDSTSHFLLRMFTHYNFLHSVSRHAEGYHNQASRETGSNDCLSDMKLWDARLTPVRLLNRKLHFPEFNFEIFNSKSCNYFLQFNTTVSHFGDESISFDNIPAILISQNGIEQCAQLRRELAVRPSQGRNFTHFDLIVVSPLTRFVVEIDLSSRSFDSHFSIDRT
jgi:hypothetical protein